MILTVCLSSTLQKTVTFDKVLLTHVNRSKTYRLDASGKAVNTARVLNQLEKGCVTSLCPLGKENAALFLELAERDGLSVKSIMIPGFTRECLTLLDYSSNETTELVVGEPVLDFDRDSAQNDFMNLLSSSLTDDCKAVVLAGSRPAVWSDDFQARLCKLSVDAGCILLADFCGKDLIKTLEICIPQIIKINEEEFCSTFGFSFPMKEEDLRDEICKKSSEWKNIIVITRGTDKTFASRNGEFFSCSIEKVTPINTTACGDSFNAGFIYEFLKSGDMQKSLQKGTWCAARNAQSEVPGAI